MSDKPMLVVEYDDGRDNDEINPNRPKFLLAMERKFGVSQPEKHEHYLWLAWFALDKPEGNLDKWLENVESVEEVLPDEDGDGDGQGEGDGQS